VASAANTLGHRLAPSQLRATELAATVRMKLRRVSIALPFMVLFPRLAGLTRAASAPSIVFPVSRFASVALAAAGCNYN
jgi:hypothetical protein